MIFCFFSNLHYRSADFNCNSWFLDCRPLFMRFISLWPFFTPYCHWLIDWSYVMPMWNVTRDLGSSFAHSTFCQSRVDIFPFIIFTIYDTWIKSNETAWSDGNFLQWYHLNSHDSIQGHIHADLNSCKYEFGTHNFSKTNVFHFFYSFHLEPFNFNGHSQIIDWSVATSPGNS